MDIFGFSGRYRSGLPESPLPLLSLAGEEMAFKTLASLNLSRSSDSESLHCASSAFDLGHLLLLSNPNRHEAEGDRREFLLPPPLLLPTASCLSPVSLGG